MAFSSNFQSRSSVGDDQHQQPNNKSWRILELAPHLQRTLIIGLVIVKNSPRFISNKQGVDRFVLNFTLRDSPSDTINVTCWGSDVFITSASECFNIGDVVEVRNAEIRLISSSSYDNSQFKPKASSPFNLTINESVSSVCRCTRASTNIYKFENLMSTPLLSPCTITPLSDVQLLDPNDNLRTRRVNLLVSIRKVGPTHELTSSKNGQPLVKCEVTVFDQSLSYFVIQLWDAEWIQYARKWTPKDCVVLAQDLKLNYNEFRKTIVGTSDGRTVFTTNPEMREALILYTFTQSVMTFEDDNSFDLAMIQDVYTVGGIKRRALEAKLPFRGILYAQLTKLDLDGDCFVTSIRCCTCKRALNATITPRQCKNPECPASTGHEITNQFQEFDISVSLTDHTGTLNRGRLRGNVADTLLSCTVDDFLKLNCIQRTSLKWEFLLERTKCYFQANNDPNGQGGFTVKWLSITKAELPEVCAKIPYAIE